jgi:hypothetical protein
MIARSSLVLLLVVAGCAPRVEVQRVGLPEPPAELTSCRDDGFKPPDPLPRLRTVEQVAHWAQEAELARQRTQAELIECARRLDRLHQWIEDHRAP